MGSKIPNPAPRPDQLWPEGVPHPTSPPPPRVRGPHGAKSEIVREARAVLTEALGASPLDKLCRDAESLANDPRLDGDARFSVLWSHLRFERSQPPAPTPTTPQP